MKIHDASIGDVVFNEIEAIINSNPGLSEEEISQLVSENEKPHFWCFYNGEIFRAVLDKVVVFLLKEKNYYSKQDVVFTDTIRSRYYMTTRWHPPNTFPENK
jgi:hypothetical protein